LSGDTGHFRISRSSGHGQGHKSQKFHLSLPTNLESLLFHAAFHSHVLAT